MGLLVVLSIAMTGLFGFLAPRFARRLTPASATWLLSIGGIIAAAMSGTALALLAFTLVGQAPPLAATGHWSLTELRYSDPVSGPVAAVSLLGVLAVLGVTVVRFVRRLMAVVEGVLLARSLHPVAGELVVVDDPAPYACAVPGFPGRIVVSAALLRSLDAPERQAVLNHEASHLAHRHYLHVALAYIAAANPLLRALPTAVDFCAERWADEDAAASSRRSTVATAVIRAAALSRVGQPASVVMAASGSDVIARVEALRAPAPQLALWRVTLMTAILLAGIAAVLLAAHDTERLFEFAQASYRSSHR